MSTKSENPLRRNSTISLWQIDSDWNKVQHETAYRMTRERQGVPRRVIRFHCVNLFLLTSMTKVSFRFAGDSDWDSLSSSSQKQRPASESSCPSPNNVFSNASSTEFVQPTVNRQVMASIEKDRIRDPYQSFKSRAQQQQQQGSESVSDSSAERRIFHSVFPAFLILCSVSPLLVAPWTHPSIRPKTVEREKWLREHGTWSFDYLSLIAFSLLQRLQENVVVARCKGSLWGRCREGRACKRLGTCDKKNLSDWFRSCFLKMNFDILRFCSPIKVNI